MYPARGRVKKIQCTTSECTIACYHEQKLIISSTALSPFSTATAIRGKLQVFSEKGGSLREFYDLLLLACARSNATPASSQSGRPRETCTRCDALWGLRSDAISPVPAQPLFSDGNSAPDSIVCQSRAVPHWLSTCSDPASRNRKIRLKSGS